MTEHTQTIYARVPDRIKEEVEAYAEANGKKQAGAVAELLNLGLAAVAKVAEPPAFTTIEQWTEEQWALYRIQGISKTLTDLGISILAGRTSDVVYYQRARLMLTQAVAEWALASSRPLRQEADNG